MSTSIIIPAAGIGSRMQLPIAKQFFELEGMPVILHLLKRIDMVSDISEVVVALKENEVDFFRDDILKGAKLKKNIKYVVGGNTRQESVKSALSAVSADSEIIMIHDAVRPLITPNLIYNAIGMTRKLKATVTAVQVKDTVKEVRDGAVVKTLDREELYFAQTPQTFERDIIIRAHENALDKGIIGTDDSALVEEMGQKVFVIPGSYDNIKITTYDDFAIAESILRIQKNTLNYF